MADDRDALSAALTDIGVQLGGTSPDMMLDIISEEIANEARRNARAKGGRRFWVHDILNSIHVEDTQGGRIVGSTHFAASFKQFGGTISAPGQGPGSLHRTYLTIPVGEARRKRWDTDKAEDAGYVLRPVTLGRRKFLFGDKARPKRPAAPPGGKRKKTKKPKTRGTLLFVLKKSVTQPSDPWFPWGPSLQAAVARGIDLYLSTFP